MCTISYVQSTVSGDDTVAGRASWRRRRGGRAGVALGMKWWAGGRFRGSSAHKIQNLEDYAELCTFEYTWSTAHRVLGPELGLLGNLAPGLELLGPRLELLYE